MALPGRTFCRLAWRLVAYESVTRARFLSEQALHQAGPGTAAPAQLPAFAQPATHAGRVMVPATKAALQSTAAFKGIFSFAR
jgi:hypothetical protein